MSENATEKVPDKAVAKHGGEKTTGGALQRLVPQNFGELERLATILCKSDIVPKDLQGKAANVLLVLMYGNEIGITPAQALQNVMVVNGRMGLCIASAVYEDSKDEFNEATMTATFKAKRKGKDWVVRSFSQKDAERAKLWTKAGPWQEYPKRMLFHRARSWALRDTFPDVLKGIRYFEEERDIVDTTATRVYAMPTENVAAAPTSTAAQGEATPPQEPEKLAGEAVAFNVYSTATTDFNGQDAYVIKDTTEPAVKYYSDQEIHFTLAKAAKASGARVAGIWVPKESGGKSFRWLLSLQTKAE